MSRQKSSILINEHALNREPIPLSSNMTPRLSGHFSIFGLVFFVLKFLLGIARHWSREKFAILTLKPGSHVRIFNISAG